VLVAVCWTWPLAVHLPTDLPGETAGDNIGFLWNVWWMRQALDSADISFFHTDRLFAPFGYDLTLHSHAALPSFAAALMSSVSLIAAQNIVILASLALNGWAAYLLAFQRTRQFGASVVGGLVFGGSAYIAAHLLGHFNLIAAWGIPLFLLFLLRARERPAIGSAVAAGVAAIAVAYTDYYYLVYCAALGAGMLAYDSAPVALEWARRSPSRAAKLVLGAVLAAALIAAIAIVVTGGFDMTIGGVPIAAHRPTNALTTAWAALIALALLTWRPSRVRRAVDPGRRRTGVRVAAAVCLVTVVGIAPLLADGWTLWRAGDYTAPRTSWRSSPAGVDLATAVLGNPRHPLTGALTRRAYVALGIDAIEQVAWLGIVPLLLVGWVSWRHPDREVRLWLAIGVAFLVWALGPWLRIGGFNTGLPLPEALMTRVPILSNARIPGRAMAVVTLAVAMLAAAAVSRFGRRRRVAMVPAIVAAVALDLVPAPFPAIAPKIPVVYADILAAGGNDIVCELPVGVRDGFAMIGRFDDRTLLYQIVHEHRIIGGFAARVPERVKQGYLQMPVVRSLFRLSAGDAADPADARLSRAEASEALGRIGIRYLVLNRQTASPALVSYVATLPAVLTRTDGPRELYTVVTGLAPTPVALSR
jgi:hypothetical protein